ncbi:MAG: hypothetical protein ABUT20_32385 [Bacteroidota bacterium]
MPEVLVKIAAIGSRPEVKKRTAGNSIPEVAGTELVLTRFIAINGKYDSKHRQTGKPHVYK